MPNMQCPHCGQTYDVPPDQVAAYANQQITCTRCNSPFTAHFGQPQQATPAMAYATPTTVGTTSGLAIAALVTGALGLLIPLLGIVGIVLGIIALRKTRDPASTGKGLAIAGISLGAVGVLISLCMLSILLPSLNRARETANRIRCASNMRQIGMAILLYENDYRAKPTDLAVLLQTQDLEPSAVVCPTHGITHAPSAMAFIPNQHTSYVYVGKDLPRLAPPDSIILYEPISHHGQDGANFLYGDGHVEFHDRASADPMIQALESGRNPPN